MKRLILSFVLLGASAWAEAVKDREGAVRADRAAMENDKRWAYNDIESGFKQAQLTGKPLLVVLRCVPCLACMGLDSAVLMQGGELEPLLDQFICVRVINANALDLTRFQFDFDLSFSTLFFNGDGTVYGRYGSWTHQKNSADATVKGYQKALEAALEIHAEYPANKAQLAGKQGGPLPFVNPTDMPNLAGRYQRELDWDGKVVGSCIHCHMIGDSLRVSYREQKQPLPTEWIYPMPAPQTVGLTLAADEVARVLEVKEGSAAAAAGLQPGDVLMSLAGQRLVSTADVSWILHRTPEAATELDVLVGRGGQKVPVKLALAEGWKLETDNSARVSAWSMRAMALGGLILVDLTDAERQTRGLSTQGMALWVKGMGMHGRHGAAKKAGFQKEDVIVELDGLTNRHTESRVMGHLLKNKMAGEEVSVRVLRGDQSKTLMLPMQ
ncbi:Trx7/PDZ domain-containing (seleno)protein [Prosthecobacter sp. SYSU 5D2]|uniref:Trx7/PDZ domain-containing (seleno)protein n=1 Tax=Prosthecobacter sp. SYSU 5D2 TaxID=3134134 RepID=UPI0031FE6F37